MATVEEKILEIKMRIEGADSVKDLKDIVAELTPQMDSLDQASEEYAQTVDVMVAAQEKLTTVMKAGKSQISAQEGSYNALVNRMAALKKVQKSVTDDASRVRLAEEINSINDQLKAYDQANGVYVRNVGNYKSALEGFDGTVVKFGDSMREAMETIEPTTQKFESVQKIATGVASGFAALQGVTALLGIENENLEKTLVKVQSAMAIAQGIGGLKDLYEGIARWGVAFGDVASKAEEMTDVVETVNTVTEASAAATNAAAAASNTAAAANTANAAATAADTTAKGAQTVATEGATVAQKGLNTAMKANPIGLVIIAITALIGLFAWLKDDIIELLGGTEKMNAAWDKFKVVFAGVGNVVKQIVLGPIKTLITSVRTLVETISNLAQGDFKGAWNAIKDGFTETVDGIKDSLDVMGNYQEAAAEKTQEIEDKRRREEAEKREKELNDYIKDMEAKSDKDWKYSEEGKKAYEELYKKRSEMYDKDSDEYKQNQRDIWMYNNEYQSRINKKEEESHKKRQEALKQALKKEKQIKEKALQEYQNLVTSYTMTDEEKLREQERARLKALKDAKDNGLFSSLEQYQEQRQKLLDKMSQDEQKFFFDKQLKEFETYFKRMDNMLKSAQTNFKFNVEIKGGEGVFDYIDTTIKNFEEVGGNIDILSEDIKNALEGIVITPDLEAKMLHILTTYDTQIEGTADKIGKLQYRVKQFTEEYGADSELTVQATQELYNIMFRYTDLQIEKFKEISDVRAAILEKTIEDEQKAMERRQLLLQQEYLEYETSNDHLWEFGNNYLSQMYKRRNAEDEIHKARIASMQEMVAAYKAASMDMQLTEEERVKAKAEQAKLEAEIERENLDYILTVNQRKAEANDKYVNAIQDSLSGISQILGSVADAWETSIQAEVKKGKISEEEGERQMENMKGIQSAIALINSFSSAVSAYQSMASIPYVGPVLGAAAAAAAIASGFAQVKAINAVKKGDKGGSSTRYAEMTPTAPEYNPTSVTNVTGGQETEDLANAMTKSNIWVSVKDIDSAQSKVKTREKESTF